MICPCSSERDPEGASFCLMEVIPRVRIRRQTEFLAPALATAAVVEQLRAGAT